MPTDTLKPGPARSSPPPPRGTATGQADSSGEGGSTPTVIRGGGRDGGPRPFFVKEQPGTPGWLVILIAVVVILGLGLLCRGW